MTVSRTTISLQEKDVLVLSRYLTREWSAFEATHNRGTSLRNFEKAAHAAGVHEVLHSQTKELIQFFAAEKIFTDAGHASVRDGSLARQMTAVTLHLAGSSIKLAIAVLLHAGLEEYLLSMCRLGLVLNRKQGLAWCKQKRVTLQDFQALGGQGSEDALLEQWTKDLERDSILDKWDRLVALVGYPKNLTFENKWHFDREMLARFDTARHDAVHHEGKSLEGFDLQAFEAQLSRAVLVITAHIAKSNALYIIPEAMANASAVARSVVGDPPI